MTDSNDILNELELDVEAQGGARLPDPHNPMALVISYMPRKEQGGQDQRVHTSGCGQVAQFVIPYEYQPDDANMVEERVVALCAACDMMPRMARFSGAPA